MKKRMRGVGLRHTIGSVGQYAGLWMVVTNAAVLVVAAVSYLHLFYVVGDVSGRERTLILETALTVLCVVALGLFTTNRLAGPWIAVRRVCDTVNDGELDVRLHVRASDGVHVSSAADSLNRVLNTLEERVRETERSALVRAS
jgi:nitrogen fixation/metabolism regulation signal transduction histidine kinase